MHDVVIHIHIIYDVHEGTYRVCKATDKYNSYIFLNSSVNMPELQNASVIIIAVISILITISSFALER